MKELFKFGGELSAKQTTILGIIGAFLLIFLWWCIVQTGWISPKILPNPIDVVKSIPLLIKKYHLFGNIWKTVFLNVYSLILSLLISIPLGFAIGIWPGIRAAFQKPIEALRYLVIPLIGGLIIAACGLGNLSKVVYLTIGLSVFLTPAIINRVSELQNPISPDHVLLQTGKTLGLSNLQLFRRIYIPYVFSSVYSEVINLLSISYTYTILAENLCRSSSIEGIGSLSSILTRMSDTPGVYCCIFIIISIGVIQDLIMRKLEPVFFPYKKK